MNEYLPINCIMVFFVGLVALAIKALIMYLKYIFVKLGRLESSNGLTWKVVGDNWGFFLGTDIKGRVRAFMVMHQIFTKKQASPDLENVAKSFRRSLLFMGLSFATALAGIILANGQPLIIIFGAMAALATTIWGILK